MLVFRVSGFRAGRNEYAVVFERAESNWAAYVPVLAGCMTTGRTLDEAKSNIQEAIQGHLDTLRRFGGPIPEPDGEAALP